MTLIRSATMRGVHIIHMLRGETGREREREREREKSRKTSRLKITLI